MATDVRQTHFRFGIEELLESTHGWYALEDVNVSLPVNTTFLLRFVEQEVGGTAAANTDATFQYNKNGAGWNDITTSSAVVKAVVSVAFTNGQNCTKRLSGTGTFETSGAGCTEDGTSGGTANDIVASGNSETECALQIVGANVTPGDTIQLRFTSPDWTITYTITPTLTVSSGNVTVTPGATALIFTRYVPAINVTNHIVVIPNVLSHTITCFIPVISAGGITVIPGVINLITTKYAPSMEVDVVVIPGTINLTATKYIPSMEIDVVVVPTTFAFTITKYLPTILIQGNTLITPGTASVVIAPFISDVLVFLPYGQPFLWTAANWGTVDICLEVYMRATSGTVYAQLFNTTNNSLVSNSRLSTVNSSFNRLRSSALALTDTNEYRVQFGKESPDTGEFLGAKLIVN